MPQVRRWQQVEIDAAAELPAFFDEIVAAGDVLPPAEKRRLERASEAAKIAIDLYALVARGHARERAPTTGRSAASGTSELVALRAFDGLDGDAILALGWERLAEERTARAAAAREIDPDADESDRHRPRQERPAGRLRGGPRGVSRLDAPRPRAT